MKGRGKRLFKDLLDTDTIVLLALEPLVIGAIVGNHSQEMIVGTFTAGRRTAFAPNFMPLLDDESEFAAKWQTLYNAHLEEGIHDPIKCYEFMNRYYVLEGNKRVSVLKVFAVHLVCRVM